MDYELLETFVVLCETGNITRTAELLYKTQPAISNRIRLLEERLGYTLICREKGKKIVTITPKGHAFLEVAKKLTALYGEIETTDARISNTLHISSISSLSAAIVAPVCRKLMADYQMNIILETYQTEDAYRLVADKTLDIAFVSSTKAINGVQSEAIATLEYSVIRSCKAPGPVRVISSAELDPSLEIYQRWNTSFQIWHDSHFGHQNYQLQIDSISLLKDFMEGTDYWSIVQNVNLPALKSSMSLQVYQLVEAPPPRICYMVTNQFPDRSSLYALKRFREALENI